MREHVKQTWDHIIAAYYRDQPPALRREVMPVCQRLRARTVIAAVVACAALLVASQQCAGGPSRLDPRLERLEHEVHLLEARHGRARWVVER